MLKAGLLFVTASAGLLLSGCDHPLQIVGKGDILSASGERNCLLEAQPCTNLVVNEYHETYYASPREGWQFVGWENCNVETGPCSFEIPAEIVQQYWGQTVAPVIAHFEPIQKPANRTIHVVALGDSITQGNDAHFSYRRNLWHLLNNAGYAIDFVGTQRSVHAELPQNLHDFDLDHEGHWGWQAGQIDAKIAEWLQAYTPDIALIHLGTNDIDHVQDDVETAYEISSIIDKLRQDNPGIVILLAKIIPIAGSKDVTVLNSYLDIVARNKASETSPLVIVDQFTGYDIDLHSYDEFHPNLAGEERLAQKWFDAMLPYLQ